MSKKTQTLFGRERTFLIEIKKQTQSLKTLSQLSTAAKSAVTDT